MLHEMKESRLEKVVNTLVKALRFVCGGVLMLMMFLTAFDVGFRYLFNAPIEGSMELVEYMMAVLIPLAVAYCASRRSHVAVDFVMDRFSRKIRVIFDFVITLLTLLFVLLVAWQGLLYVGEVHESGVTSAVLLISAYPFVVPVGLGMGIFALVLVKHLIEKKEEEAL